MQSQFYRPFNGKKFSLFKGLFNKDPGIGDHILKYNDEYLGYIINKKITDTDIIFELNTNKTVLFNSQHSWIALPKLLFDEYFKNESNSSNEKIINVDTCKNTPFEYESNNSNEKIINVDTCKNTPFEYGSNSSNEKIINVDTCKDNQIEI
jgi:hypothetical protein